jgi:hypothetical protein
MRFLAWLPLWLRAVLRRGAVEREMAREIRFHLDREIELNLAWGMDPTEARRQALVAFGGVERAKEGVRDQRHTIWLEQAIADARFALRSLRRRPLFAIVAVGTSALAIGATTAIFTIVDNVLFRAIPTAGTGRLVAVWETIPAWRSQPFLASSWDHVVMDYPDFRHWRARQSAFVAVCAIAGGSATLWTDGRPEQLSLTCVSPSLFAVLGTAPALGRLSLPGEDVVGGPQVTIIGYDTWQSRFGGRSSIIGTGVLLDSVRYDIVGVLPKDFAIVRGQRPRPFYVPAGQSRLELVADRRGAPRRRPHQGRRIVPKARRALGSQRCGGNMYRIHVLALAGTLALPLATAASQSQAKTTWDALQFLQGRWVGEGTSEVGAGGGYFTFEPDLNGTVWVRRNHAEYPAANRAPIVHEDLMIVYVDPDGATLRAFYTDTERHVIPYVVSVSAGRDTASFVSEPPPGQPTYRLTYVRRGADRMSVTLEMAPADHPQQFKVVVQGSVRKP